MSNNEKGIGGRNVKVTMPKPLHEQLAAASEAQIARDGGSYLKPRESAHVLPAREANVAPTINDRLERMPERTKPGGAQEGTDLPPGMLRDEKTGRVRYMTQREASEREKKDQK